MSTRRVRAEDMRPGRKYVIEIPAGAASLILTSAELMVSDDMFPREIAPMERLTITLAGLKPLEPGIIITEHIEWENGAVYKDKLHGKLYLRQGDKCGWVRLPYKSQNTLFISDISALSMDFENRLVKLVEEK